MSSSHSKHPSNRPSSPLLALDLTVSQKLRLHFQVHQTEIPQLVRDDKVPRQSWDNFMQLQLERRGGEEGGSYIRLQDIYATQKRKILLLGGSGVGKSTLLQYITHSWGKGDLWQEFTYVFRISGSVLKNGSWRSEGQNYNSFAILTCLIHKCLRLQGCREITLEEIDSCLASQEKRLKTLLLFDGYNEMGCFLNDQTREDILEDFWAEIMSFGSVLVSARPNCVKSQHKKSFEDTLECKGFSWSEVRAYIDFFFKKSEAGLKGELLSLLLRVGRIRGMALIPINLTLICIIWSSGDRRLEEISKTSALYEKVIEWLGKRFLVTAEALDPELFHVESVRQHSVYKCMQKIAFKSFWHEKNISFKNGDSDLEGVRFELLRNFGLLKPQSDLETTQALEIPYEFIHSSFQEYLVATYLVRVGFVDEAAGFRGESLTQLRYESRWLMVWKFIAGMLSNSGSKDSITFFWESMACNADSVIELNSSDRLALLLDLLAECALVKVSGSAENFEVSFDPNIPNLEAMLDFVDEAILSNRKGRNFFWTAKIIRSGYMSPKLKSVLFSCLESFSWKKEFVRDRRTLAYVYEMIDFICILMVFGSKIGVSDFLFTKVLQHLKEIGSGVEAAISPLNCYLISLKFVINTHGIVDRIFLEKLLEHVVPLSYEKVGDTRTIIMDLIRGILSHTASLGSFTIELVKAMGVIKPSSREILLGVIKLSKISETELVELFRYLATSANILDPDDSGFLEFLSGMDLRLNVKFKTSLAIFNGLFLKYKEDPVGDTQQRQTFVVRLSFIMKASLQACKPFERELVSEYNKGLVYFLDKADAFLNYLIFQILEEVNATLNCNRVRVISGFQTLFRAFNWLITSNRSADAVQILFDSLAKVLENESPCCPTFFGNALDRFLQEAGEMLENDVDSAMLTNTFAPIRGVIAKKAHLADYAESARTYPTMVSYHSEFVSRILLSLDANEQEECKNEIENIFTLLAGLLQTGVSEDFPLDVLAHCVQIMCSNGDFSVLSPYSIEGILTLFFNHASNMSPVSALRPKFLETQLTLVRFAHSHNPAVCMLPETMLYLNSVLEDEEAYVEVPDYLIWCVNNLCQGEKSWQEKVSYVHDFFETSIRNISNEKVCLSKKIQISGAIQGVAENTPKELGAKLVTCLVENFMDDTKLVQCLATKCVCKNANFKKPPALTLLMRAVEIISVLAELSIIGPESLGTIELASCFVASAFDKTAYGDQIQKLFSFLPLPVLVSYARSRDSTVLEAVKHGILLKFMGCLDSSSTLYRLKLSDFKILSEACKIFEGDSQALIELLHKVIPKIVDSFSTEQVVEILGEMEASMKSRTAWCYGLGFKLAKIFLEALIHRILAEKMHESSNSAVTSKNFVATLIFTVVTYYGSQMTFTRLSQGESQVLSIVFQHRSYTGDNRRFVDLVYNTLLLKSVDPIVRQYKNFSPIFRNTRRNGAILAAHDIKLSSLLSSETELGSGIFSFLSSDICLVDKDEVQTKLRLGEHRDVFGYYWYKLKAGLGGVDLEDCIHPNDVNKRLRKKLFGKFPIDSGVRIYYKSNLAMTLLETVGAELEKKLELANLSEFKEVEPSVLLGLSEEESKKFELIRKLHMKVDTIIRRTNEDKKLSDEQKASKVKHFNEIQSQLDSHSGGLIQLKQQIEFLFENLEQN